jgi:hypothetical protein
MEAICSTEKQVDVYGAMHYYILEDTSVYNHHGENFKSIKSYIFRIYVGL